MRQQVASAIHVVIQLSRMSDGTRKVVSISEIVGMEGDVITMQDIFKFERQGLNEEGEVVGRFRSTGIRPRFAERLQSYGVDLGELLFSDREPAHEPNQNGLRPLRAEEPEEARVKEGWT